METHQTVRRFGQALYGNTTISFFSAPAPLVAQTLVEWGRKVWRKVTKFSPLRGTWDEFLGEYVTPDSRIVLAPTRGEWSALINNDRIGNVPFSELLIIPERLKCRSAAFVIGDLERCREEKRPCAAMFHHCDGTQGQPMQRSIGLVCDGEGWEYHETGQPLPFEEPLARERRPKAERLTPEMLVRYARALGIELDTGDSFYDLSQAIGLEWKWDQSPLGVLRVLGQELGVYRFLDAFRH